MGSYTSFTEADEGKEVVNQNDETVGRVVRVDGSHAYVDPVSNATDATASRLGWGSRDERSYTLDSASVETITDDEIRLSSL